MSSITNYINWDWVKIYTFVQFGVPAILSLIGTLAVLGGAYIRLTPLQKEGSWYSRLESTKWIGAFFKVLVRFSPIYRKEVEIEKEDEKK